MAVTVLLIEDNVDVLEVLRIALTIEGCTVTTAENGAQALAIIESIQSGVIYPDIIITDIRMPDMNGLELIRLIRARPSTLHTPIIAMSAEHEVALDHAKDSGANETIKKPVDPNDLLILIKELVKEESV